MRSPMPMIIIDMRLSQANGFGVKKANVNKVKPDPLLPFHSHGALEFSISAI